jgi:hypothetical protein
MEIATVEAGHLAEGKRMGYLQEKMRQSEDRRVREEGEKVERQRLAKLALRWSQMWVEGTPTEMAYLIAQAIANIATCFHPDPDNPPSVIGFVAEIETTDEVPVA